MSAIFDVFAGFDLAVFEWFENVFNTGANTILDTIMYAITTLGDGGIIWIVLAIVLCVFKRYRKYGLMMLGALIFMLVVNNVILKNLFARPRPFVYFADNSSFNFPDIVSMDTLASTSNATGYEYSFPSGHTTSSFAAIIPLYKADKKFGIPATVLAFLIAVSRIYVHVHYCTDILFGIVLGIIYGIIGCLIVGALLKLWNKKKPESYSKLFAD